MTTLAVKLSAFLFLLVAIGHYVAAEDLPTDKKLTKSEVDELLQGTDPCACALLNFWDGAPRPEASACCDALNRICYFQSNTVKCGHVHRFCMKRRAGFSAWVLDTFVREKLTLLVKEYNMTCDAFNPDATHESELCGSGYCRIGYYCAEVRASHCKDTKALPCGKGYCPVGSQCAEMTSESCKMVKQNKIDTLGEISYDKISCKDGNCKVCTQKKDYECAYESELKAPCDTASCSNEVTCEKESRFVCQMRPDAKNYLSSNSTMAPEIVNKKYLRFTAFVLPALAGVISTIVLIALVSWITIRVQKAKKETGFRDDTSEEGIEANKQEKYGHHPKSSVSRMSVEEVPLTPTSTKSPMSRNMADILSPRLRLPLGNVMKAVDVITPRSEKRSARSANKRLFSPRSPYQSLDDGDMNTLAEQSNESDSDFNAHKAL